MYIKFENRDDIIFGNKEKCILKNRKILTPSKNTCSIKYFLFKFLFLQSRQPKAENMSSFFITRKIHSNILLLLKT